MRVTFLAPRLPPAVCGVADHTQRLAQAMASHGVEVGFISCSPVGNGRGPLPGPIDLWQGGSQSLCQLLERQRSDWLWVQLTCYAFSPWGVPFALARVLKSVLRRVPTVRLAVCAHEIHYEQSQYRRLGFVRAPLQQRAMRRVTELADLVFTAPSSFRRRIIGDYGLAAEKVVRLPIGSNLPWIPRDPQRRLETRRSLGWQADDTVAVTFGLFPTQIRALRQCADSLRDGIRMGRLQRVVCVGGHDVTIPAELAKWRSHFGQTAAFAVLGPQPEERVAEILNASDFGFLSYPSRLLDKSGAYAAYALAGLAVIAPTEVEPSPCDDEWLPHITMDSWDWREASSPRVERLRQRTYEYATANMRWESIASAALSSLADRLGRRVGRVCARAGT